MQKILFVCHGNICRSPMAEFMMKKKVLDAGLEGDFMVESAATSSEEIGNDIYPPAMETLRRHGIPFTRRKARRITRADYVCSDHIFVMDSNNMRWLERMFPGMNGDVRMLMSLCGMDRDVADPWYTGDFEATYNDIDLALDTFLQSPGIAKEPKNQ